MAVELEGVSQLKVQQRLDYHRTTEDGDGDGSQLKLRIKLVSSLARSVVIVYVGS